VPNHDVNLIAKGNTVEFKSAPAQMKPDRTLDRIYLKLLPWLVLIA